MARKPVSTNASAASGFWKDTTKIMQFPKEGIYSTVLAKSETYNYTLMCLAGGTTIDTHTSAKAGIVYVIKGKGTFALAGATIPLMPGTFIFMQKNAPHSLDASEDLALLLCLTE
ncbi:cupin domain-containing protein [Candidatus Woesearchaeota archaeon CG_4_10_14_0_8_um_filter_47_5]|nr:MAG: cupin domain-containing protein [Candidatus Woesearchaeota archaeon CG_4_10_14_0_8_um_filter_47_5]